MKLINIVNDILNEGSITPGSKEYFKPNMSDDEILELAKELTNIQEQKHHLKFKGFLEMWQTY